MSSTLANPDKSTGGGFGILILPVISSNSWSLNKSWSNSGTSTPSLAIERKSSL